ncbi:MAG: LysR family transcriptional regulator [Pseudomonadota bacterium]
MREINDLRKVRHAVAVARSGSFTSAAKVLSLTQSAVTKSVAELEDALGFKIFQRTARGVRPTATGESFLPRAERLLGDAAELLIDVRDGQMLAAGSLRVGVGPAAFVAFLEPALTAFARIYPALTLTLESGSEDPAVQSLLQGDVDLIVGSESHLSAWREIETRSIAALQMYFIARRDHPLAEQNDVSAEQILSYPIVMPSAGLGVDQTLRQAYAQAGMKPVAPRYRCDQFSLVRGLVEATEAVAPLLSVRGPSASFRQQFCVLPNLLGLEQPMLAVGMLRGREPSAAARAFADLFERFPTDAEMG